MVLRIQTDFEIIFIFHSLGFSVTKMILARVITHFDDYFRIELNPSFEHNTLDTMDTIFASQQRSCSTAINQAGSA